MPGEITVKRQTLDRQAIDEIEKNAVAKCHEKLIHLLQAEPLSFSYFKSLKKVEANVYYLAKDYLDCLKKDLVSYNEEIEGIAERFVNDLSAYDFIKRFDRSALNNKILVKSLIGIVRDCVDSGYQLATYREKSRREANIEDIKETLSRLERHNARIEHDNARREKKLDDLLAKTGLNSNAEQIAAALHPEAPMPVQLNASLLPSQSSPSNANVQQPCESSNRSPTQTPKLDARKRTRTVAPKDSPSPKMQRFPKQSPNNTIPTNAQNGPWRYVSEEECKRLRAQNYFSDKFVKALLPKIYSPAELLLPLKDLPVEKKEDFLKIVCHFYGTALVWNNAFKVTMKNLRVSRRREIFKSIGKTKGYGIASNGKHYFYKLSPRMCFKNDECVPSGNLRTRTIGNIPVPESIGNFEYILLIEKQGFMSKFQKLYANGKIEKIQ